MKSFQMFLCFQASFEDGHGALQLDRSYTSPSHTYLQIQKPSAAAEVNAQGFGSGLLTRFVLFLISEA